MFYKKLVSLDRPVTIKGKDLKEKLKIRITQLDEKIAGMNKTLTDNFSGSILEGTIKAEQKREILRAIHDFETQKVWVNKLLEVILDKNEYALNLTEATTLGIIKQ